MWLRKTTLWYDFFDLNDHRWWLYPLLVLVDHMYGRLVYCAGKFQNDIRGDYPALIPMDRAGLTFRTLVKAWWDRRWVPPGHSRSTSWMGGFPSRD